MYPHFAKCLSRVCTLQGSRPNGTAGHKEASSDKKSSEEDSSDDDADTTVQDLSASNASITELEGSSDSPGSGSPTNRVTPMLLPVQPPSPVHRVHQQVSKGLLTV